MNSRNLSSQVMGTSIGQLNNMLETARMRPYEQRKLTAEADKFDSLSLKALAEAGLAGEDWDAKVAKDPDSGEFHWFAWNKKDPNRQPVKLGAAPPKAVKNIERETIRNVDPTPVRDENTLNNNLMAYRTAIKESTSVGERRQGIEGYNSTAREKMERGYTPPETMLLDPSLIDQSTMDKIWSILPFTKEQTELEVPLKSPGGKPIPKEILLRHFELKGMEQTLLEIYMLQKGIK